jgi:peptidoglycan hydrolase CwlO-like protein
MNRLLIVAILMLLTAPLYAQGQQPDMAKLKADAQKVVSIISSDKGKTQTYCQISDLNGQIGEANEEQNSKKAGALSRKVNELEKKLGPEYAALANSLKDVDPNSPEGAEISSILEPLDDTCPD